MENTLFDTVIIGCGPAGMTSSIYLGRANKTVAIIDKEGYGGNIAKSPKVENIPGFASISGDEFATKMFNQMSKLSSVTYILGEAVLVSFKLGIFIVSLADNSAIYAKSLIFATGTKPRTLNLSTKNLYSCVTCDGPFFKKKPVVVVGSGNTGATYALELATYCKHVYLCDISMTMLCEPILQDKIKKVKNITFLPNCTITKTINVDSVLESVVLSTGGTLKVEAIFNATGAIPQTSIIGQFANLNEKGYITGTDIPGVFAAGDCTANKVKQVTTACSSGTIAAINIINYLNSIKN